MDNIQLHLSAITSEFDCELAAPLNKSTNPHMSM